MIVSMNTAIRWYLVSVQVEDPVGNEPKLLDTGLLHQLRLCDLPEVTLAVGMPAGLDPDPERTVVDKECVSSFPVDDKR